MASNSLALVDLLAEIPDFRQSKGRRYPLSSVLSLAVAATLCGYKSYSAIAEWGRNYGQAFVQALGFLSHKTPAASTLHSILRQVDIDLLEAKLAQWAESLLQTFTPNDLPYHPLAIDGKTLRGSKKQGALDTHLLSVLSHHTGLTLFQHSVDEKTNEIGAISSVLENLILEGKIVTVDALLTQRKVAEEILKRGGEYVMIVKENQPQLRSIIEGAIEGIPFYWEEAARAETIDCGHGRIEERKLVATSVLSGQEEIWPGIEQVFRIERKRRMKSKESEEVEYGVTSLRREEVRVEELMKVIRGHWAIENKSHWVRDETYGEDKSQVRKGKIGQAMAAMRNTAIGLMRMSGEENIARACRRMAARPWEALALIGFHQKTE